MRDAGYEIRLLFFIQDPVSRETRIEDPLGREFFSLARLKPAVTGVGD
jgi:hypothetical protein